MSSIRKKLAGKTTKLAQPRKPSADHPASVNTYADGSFFHIDIGLIKPDPNQPRQFFDELALQELAESIKQKGILQPVLIRKDEANQVWLVAGERRYRAAQMAGLKKIPAILTTGNPAEIALIENIQRENLKPVEEAEALGKMVHEFQYTHEHLAKVIGKARTTITETLTLNKLPEEIKKECRRADIYPRRLLVEISKQKTPAAMIKLFKKAKDANLKSDQVRQLTRKSVDRKVRTQAAIALERTMLLTCSLPKIDLDRVEEKEKIQLLGELQKLKQLIETLIS